MPEIRLWFQQPAAGFVNVSRQSGRRLGPCGELFASAALSHSGLLAQPADRQISRNDLAGQTFSLFGFIIGIWADGFEKLQMIPMLVVTPLTFLGGSFYSVNMLPPAWRAITLLNPVVYLISGFRWSFYEIADVSVTVSICMTVTFLVICMVVVAWIFKTGYRLKN